MQQFNSGLYCPPPPKRRRRQMVARFVFLFLAMCGFTLAALAVVHVIDAEYHFYMDARP